MFINSWRKFVEVADQLDVGPPGKLAYAYRGQPNAGWGLEPTLLRHLKRLKMTEEESLHLEASALSEFRSQAHLLLPSNVFSTTKDTISWWALMQQHGAPTRLLDWTGSIYVAAYFAVIEQIDCDGVVWLVHSNSLHEKMNESFGQSDLPASERDIREQYLKKGAPPLIVFGERLHKSDRMIAQQGAYSICRTVLGDHGKIIEDALAGQSGRTLFEKLIIPARLKVSFVRKLRSMNITAKSLFPGLDGLGRSVSELVTLGNK